MKVITHKRIKQMLTLMNRKRAYFWIEKKDGLTYYTYPKAGWISEPTVNGVPVVYVPEHDTDEPPIPGVIKVNGHNRMISCPVFGLVGAL